MGTKAKHPVAPTIRGAFLRAIERKENRDRVTFSEMMLEEIDEKGLLTVMDKVARFVERTSDVTVNTEEETLADILTGLNAAREPKTAFPIKSVN